MIDRLVTFFANDPDAPIISSIFAEQWNGKADSEWFPEIVRGGWIPVSVDQGRKRSRGPALPDLCEEARIAHVLGSVAFHQRKQQDKLLLFSGVWPALRTSLELSTHGERIIIQLTPKQTPTLKILQPPFKRPRRDDRQR